MRRGLLEDIRDHYEDQILGTLELQVVGINPLPVLGLLNSDAFHI